jgi:nucleoside-diphosphate-sugar epimerase
MAGQVVAIVGGGGFVGHAIGRALTESGAEVYCLNRSGESRDCDVQGVATDRQQTVQTLATLDRIQADVIIDCIGLSERDTIPFINALNERGGTYVFVSSVDVYAAFGRVLGTEPGNVDNTPLNETSPLRTVSRPFKNVEGREEYDKIPLEKHALAANNLDGRIARLPAMFGPNDPRRRFRDVAEAVLSSAKLAVPPDAGVWRFDLLYVKDAGLGVAALALSETLTEGAVFHFGPDVHVTQLEEKRRFAQAAGFEVQVTVKGDAVSNGQDILLDSSLARSHLRWQPQTPIDDAYRITWEWEARRHSVRR